MHPARRFLLAAALATLAILSPLAAAPARTTPREDAYARFLARYLDTSAADGVNRLRYADVAAADSQALEAHVRAMQGRRPSRLPRAARMAFWIDLYNARTVLAVLHARPIRSIREVRPSGPGVEGPWKAPLLDVEGRPLSLDDVENAVLRPGFRDPRVHFALNCASLGCPELARVPYAAADLDRALDAAARAFVASPHGVAFEGDDVRLSSLFEWYRGDFGKSEREVLEYLARYATPERAARLRGHRGRVRYGYDWALNGT
jgi:hypothetical protein